VNVENDIHLVSLEPGRLEFRSRLLLLGRKIERFNFGGFCSYLA